MSVTLSTVCNYGGNMLPTCGNSVKWIGCNCSLLPLRVYKNIYLCKHTMSACSLCCNLVSICDRYFPSMNLSVTPWSYGKSIQNMLQRF